ncbi:MAG: T9SS type A sorting domain-containing protein [Bacteroidia bacterium]
MFRKNILILILCGCVNVYGYQPASYWVNQFNTVCNNPFYAYVDGNNYNAWDYWNILSQRGYVHYTAPSGYSENTFEGLGYALNNLLSMYEATNDLFYLQKAIEYSDNILASSHVLLPNEGIAGYSSGKNFKGYYQGANANNPNITEEIKPFRYILKLARLIMSNASLEVMYGNKAQNYANFITYHIWHKWAVYNNANCLYIMKPATSHIACNWAFIANDLYWLSLNFGLGTSNPLYLSQYNLITHWFNTNIRWGITPQYNKFTFTIMDNYLGNDCDNQPYFNYASSTNVYNGLECIYEPNDVSHANFIISYLIERYETFPNSPYTLSNHFQGLINTFINKIWNGCNDTKYNPARMSELMDGTFCENNGECDCADKGGTFLNTGYFVGEGWAKLGRYSCIMQDALEDFIFCQLPTSPTDPSLAYLHDGGSDYKSSIYAQMALNAKLLDQYLNGHLFIDGIIGFPSNYYTASHITVAANSPTIVLPNTHNVIRANRSITFKAGFYSPPGANLHAYIDNDMCSSELPIAPNNNSNNENPFMDYSIKLNLYNNNYKPYQRDTGLQNIISGKNIIYQHMNNYIVLFPNPNTGQFTIVVQTLNEQEQLQLSVMDVYGKQILNQQIANSVNHQIDLSAYSKGIYYVSVTGNNGFREVKKVVVN